MTFAHETLHAQALAWGVSYFITTDPDGIEYEQTLLDLIPSERNE